MMPSIPDLPLCVDLDGTLTPVDTLHEALLGIVRSAPGHLPGLGQALKLGKAEFKSRVAQVSCCDAAHLPWNTELLAWLRGEKSRGRQVILVTASDARTARAVADELQLFDEVIASDGERNLSGETKREALVARYGERGFDYVGNDEVDLAVWRSAAQAIVVGNGDLARRAAAQAPVQHHFRAEPASIGQWLKAIRLYQWVKNLLVFVPALVAHRILEPGVLGASLLAFVAFGLCASSGYLLNDLMDLASDRRHPRKRLRPFASGAIPARQGLVVGGVMLLAALVLALMINAVFAVVLAGYFACTMTYSLGFKKFALIDVMLLAGLYTVRVIAGNAATEIWPSFWLLGFSVFIFLSLGIVKRYAELSQAFAQGQAAAHGRGYRREDLPALLGFGIAAGYNAVIILALYINSTASEALYQTPLALWLLCPMTLFWISRVWLMTVRGHMQDDPILFALRDRMSLAVAGLMAATALLAV